MELSQPQILMQRKEDERSSLPQQMQHPQLAMQQPPGYTAVQQGVAYPQPTQLMVKCIIML